jgi:hypothetical protein
MDNVLNLSAFGEVIPNKKKEKEDITFKSFMSEPKPSEEVPDKPVENEKDPASFVATKALMHSSQIKLLHWQTKSYAEHKALDKLFNGIIGFQDDLVEVIMGKYGRPTIDGDISLFNYVDCDCSEAIEKIKHCYCHECKSFFTPEEDPEILNILDEIIALLDKTMYLLTLK